MIKGGTPPFDTIWPSVTFNNNLQPLSATVCIFGTLCTSHFLGCIVHCLIKQGVVKYWKTPSSLG